MITDLLSVKALTIPEPKPALSQHFVVLGGGIAGLATAYELSKRGIQVTVVEKAEEVGGLARTLNYDGFRFDIGGHRFHSNNSSVVQWLKDLLQTDLQVVPRISHIYLNQQFVDYPIQFANALAIFPPLKAAQMVMSYLGAKISPTRQEISFEDWVIKRYGKALYEVFFKPYTEKVWGMTCDRLAATWAAQRIRVPSLWKTLQNMLFQKQGGTAPISQFYYPRSGFGMIPSALEAEIIKRGGIVYTSTALSELAPTSNGFDVTIQQQDGTTRTIAADQVVSTLPLNYLLQSIPKQWGSQEILDAYDLKYRDMVCLFLALKKPQVSQDSWTYFPMQDLVFGRTHEPKNWSSEMVPSPEFTSLAVEIFSSRGEAIWQLPDAAIAETVVEQMSQIGWIQKADVHQSWVLRVPYAYPIYEVGYENRLKVVKDYLGQWQNLHLVGRTGSFHYMNSDGVIEDVFRLIEQLFPEQAAAVSPLGSQVGRWL
ncbi:FAD-dependent oxidoreductase [Leptolyngbya sp. FACHB-17]|uniref:FAD-dependent oxidoreductase n=1 Tax=unclassified Leptolyngbya TaxID=2650499 RepID=UPI00168134C1|nr:FAD-dependent oxidoreductase [Leptolyngbya sp. FACHB-17]MBD2081290.1 FAD-dependent oxidoreductase [Leptolyngbya sp. FACHB-17]